MKTNDNNPENNVEAENKKRTLIPSSEIALLIICLCLCGAIVAYSFISANKSVTPVVIYAASSEEIIPISSSAPSESVLDNAVNITEPVSKVEVSVSSDASSSPIGKININFASAAELNSLPGIGEVKAAAIVDYRTEHGNFATVGELTQVSGIGEKTLEKIREYITVE